MLTQTYAFYWIPTYPVSHASHLQLAILLFTVGVLLLRFCWQHSFQERQTKTLTQHCHECRSALTLRTEIHLGGKVVNAVINIWFLLGAHGHHMLCALIGTSHKPSSYLHYAGSLWMRLEYELVAANSVYPVVHNGRVRPATRSVVATYCTPCRRNIVPCNVIR